MLTVGLMSGTSLDGIDAALIDTDGKQITKHFGGITLPYEYNFRNRLRARLGCVETNFAIQSLEDELTSLHANAVSKLLHTTNVNAEQIGLIGFHGHTICHQPDRRFSWQLGNGEKLAKATGIDVVSNFRSDDVAAGGEGAPLVPVYHRALCHEKAKPLAILNLGGIANVTWLGDNDDMVAFDTGPANALIDDWMLKKTGAAYDRNGSSAASGKVHIQFVSDWLNDNYFSRSPPKSLDRDFFNIEPIKQLSVDDGAATLTAFTAKAVASAIQFLPSPPLRWLVTGGGRKNTTLMEFLASSLGSPVSSIESMGWNGDLIEAEAFAFLALRSRYNLPITFPGTTGVANPLTGGQLFESTKKVSEG